jgi:type IV secretory pathway VirB2 component (pilin)
VFLLVVGIAALASAMPKGTRVSWERKSQKVLGLGIEGFI